MPAPPSQPHPTPSLDHHLDFAGTDRARGVAVPTNTHYAQNQPAAAPVTPNPAFLAAAQHQPFMTYHDPPHHAEPDQFTGFDGAPLAWDWANPTGYTDFSHHYEPQGELVRELHQPSTTNNDFSLPLPVYPSDNDPYQSPQNYPNPPAAAPRSQVVTMASKRKADSDEPTSALSHGSNLSVAPDQHLSKRPNKSRSSSTASATSPVVATASSSDPTHPAAQAEHHANNEAQRRKEQSRGTGPQGRVIDVSKPRRVPESPGGYEVLPAGKVFPIQLGSELFRLSGASLSSDAPSYFSHFFREQLHSNQGRAGDMKTLYIDRDPNTFRDIAAHLQGYHITPKDGEHFVRLFADAQFYSLPRLTKQLFSTDIFIRIGGVPFTIPRDLFSSPGDSPNYFSLGFAQFFSTPAEVFPGLDRNALLRPPSIHPPSVPNRSGKIFRELVEMLQGYPVDIRNEAHRAQLLRDARYFHLKGLEQKLIPCDISYNLKRAQTEILIRLEDLRQSGVSFIADPASNPASNDNSNAPSNSGSASPSVGGQQLKPGTVSYARPYTDDHSDSNVLVLELSSNESTTLHLPQPSVNASHTTEPPALHARVTFRGTTLARITSLFSVIASKMGLPANQPLGLMMLQSGGGVAAQPVSAANSGLSEPRVRVRIDSDCHLEINNVKSELAADHLSGNLGLKYNEPGNNGWIWGGAETSSAQAESDEEQERELVITRAHWRLRVEFADGDSSKMHVVLCGARIEGYSEERSRNSRRGFLG
ncbi:unnamed protein product [Periconia digitata]|uniref:BTB/POZ domain-containing protein n=1 Tax=Periconia digitata TaxID=1303443 RepID=A0A9W4UKK8_9PLEO|nr:unnamed protein product [Periconia digitata]